MNEEGLAYRTVFVCGYCDYGLLVCSCSLVQRTKALCVRSMTPSMSPILLHPRVGMLRDLKIQAKVGLKVFGISPIGELPPSGKSVEGPAARTLEIVVIVIDIASDGSSFGLLKVGDCGDHAPWL